MIYINGHDLTIEQVIAVSFHQGTRQDWYALPCRHSRTAGAGLLVGETQGLPADW